MFSNKKRKNNDIPKDKHIRPEKKHKEKGDYYFCDLHDNDKEICAIYECGGNIERKFILKK